MSRLLSDRVKKTPSSQVSAERYDFLKLSEAEPDLGVPSATGSVLVSTSTGVRSWTDEPVFSAVDVELGLRVLDGTSGVVSETSGSTFSLTTDVATTIDSWDKTQYRSAKYIIQVSQGFEFQVSEFRLIHNGTNAFFTEYSVLSTNGDLATLTADISENNVRIQIELSIASAAEIKMQRTLLTV
jgi:hypothetical protein